MGKVVVSTYMALDGVIENPMWTFPYWGDDIAAFQTTDLFGSDALLLGRETYEAFAGAWPPRAGADEFADRINAMPKYVASRTMDSAEWNSTVIQGDVAEEIARLKQGQNLLKYGGGELLHFLIENRLLDELHVLVYPVLVGKGARLVPEGSEGALKLVESKTFDSGVIALTYHLANPVEAEEA
jgi:dihydrofolate reductase